MRGSQRVRRVTPTAYSEGTAMSQPELETRLREFEQLRPERFRFLELLSVTRSADLHPTDELSLVLVLYSPASPESAAIPRLRLDFEGVSDLQIGSLEGLLAWRLKLSDIRSRQLDRARIQVKEVENEALSFFCRSLDFEVLEETG